MSMGQMVGVDIGAGRDLAGWVGEDLGSSLEEPTEAEARAWGYGGISGN